MGVVIVMPHQCACMWGMVVVSVRGGGGGRAKVRAGIDVIMLMVVVTTLVAVCVYMCYGSQCERWLQGKGKGGRACVQRCAEGGCKRECMHTDVMWMGRGQTQEGGC